MNDITLPDGNAAEAEFTFTGEWTDNGQDGNYLQTWWEATAHLSSLTVYYESGRQETLSPETAATRYGPLWVGGIEETAADDYQPDDGSFEPDDYEPRED